MFAKHQPKISAYARKNPDNFAAVLRFVVVTIQNRLFNCPSDCETVSEVITGRANDATELAAQGILYGHKRGAVETIQAEKESLFWQAEEIFYHATSEREAASGLIALFVSIPGLGMVKAGFAAQLIYGVAGCLDSHNIARYGIDPKRLKSDLYKNAKTYKTRQKHLNFYLDLCEQFGGCESLWNSWCEHLAIASKEDKTGIRMNGNKPLYENADHVSALHCVALGVEP